MPSEFLLVIFLLASMLIFVFFYATRARARGRVPMSKIERPGADEASEAETSSTR